MAISALTITPTVTTREVDISSVTVDTIIVAYSTPSQPHLRTVGRIRVGSKYVTLYDHDGNKIWYADLDGTAWIVEVN